MESFGQRLVNAMQSRQAAVTYLHAGISRKRMWLFDLTIDLCDADGKILFSNGNGRPSQVKIIFQKRRTDIETPASEEDQQLQCIGKTYVLIDTAEVINRLDWEQLSGSGRAPWGSYCRKSRSKKDSSQSEQASSECI